MSTLRQSVHVEPEGTGIRVRLDAATNSVWLPVSMEDFNRGLQSQPRFQADGDEAQ